VTFQKTASLRLVRSRPRLWFLLFMSLIVPVAEAEISGLEWSDSQVVGPGLLSDASSPSAAYTPIALQDTWPELWHIVYVSDSSLIYRTHDGSDWGEPLLLATQSELTNPRLSFGGDALHVVWEDERSGHSELYTRMFNGTTWSSEECLACDSSYTRDPALAGGLESALVAYRQSNGLWARHWENGQWGDPEPVADFLGFYPSVAIAGDRYNSNRYLVAWEDARHGASEIYLRTRDRVTGWLPEERITEMAGHCRRPSLTVDTCCNDALFDYPVVVFECLEASIPEVWVHTPYETTRLSASDGVPSAKPQVNHYSLRVDACWWGLEAEPRFFVTWEEGTDEVTYKIARFQVYTVAEALEIEDAGSGDVGPIIAAGDGIPYASILHLTQTDGVLSSRTGAELGCYWQAFELGPALVVAPGGWPTTRIAQVNWCGGDYMNVWWTSALRFDEIANTMVNWGPDQEHPFVILDFEGPETFVDLSIRGGGCVPDGTADIFTQCSFPPDVWAFEGIRSPDIDGDCRVSQADLDYVEAALGTDDFCADLDGSGLVDESDIGIVTATFGDACLDDPASTSTDAYERPIEGLRISPQPSSGPFGVALTLLQDATTVRLTVHDPQGRLVREFGARPLGAGTHRLVWDGLDRNGRPAPAGSYYLRAALDDRVVEGQLVIVR